MKFITTSMSKCKSRIGIIREFEKKPNLSFDTPLLLLYTKRGCITHLTKDVLKSVTPEPQILSVSLPTTINMNDSLKEFDSFGEFISMQEYPIFLTIQDPAEKTDPCNQKQNIISIWGKQGRVKLTSNNYTDLVEMYKPDIYLTLCDGDTDMDSSNKRITHAVEKSMQLLDKCLKNHENSEVLKNTPILGAIEGGYSLAARENCIKHLINKPLFGYVIDGLHKNGSGVADMDFQVLEIVVKHCVNLLPEDKLRVMMGCYNPPTVLNLIELGIDVFDSSYAYIMTEQNKAIVFLCDDCDHASMGTLNMMDKNFADDFSPLCKYCKCLTCTNHTRAYINHLCLTKELLGPVLLMMHNLHTYIEFFKSIRYHIKEGTLTNFRQKITEKYTNSKNI